jgi:hypothetical protein
MVQVAQLCRGLQAEFNLELEPDSLVDRERVDLPSTAVEREHVAFRQRLTQRPLGQRTLQPDRGHQVLAQPKVGVGQQLLGDEPALGQLSAELLGPPSIAHRTERVRRSPQGERGLEQRDDLGIPFFLG